MTPGKPTLAALATRWARLRSVRLWLGWTLARLRLARLLTLARIRVAEVDALPVRVRLAVMSALRSAAEAVEPLQR